MPAKKRKSNNSLNTSASKWTKRTPVTDAVAYTFYDPVHTSTVLPLRVNDNRPLLFYIPGLEKINIDMSQIWLKMKLRIVVRNATSKQWEPLAGGLNLAPICGIFYTLFNDIELLLNDELVDSSKQNYQVIYLHTTINFSALYLCKQFFSDRELFAPSFGNK